MSKNAVVAFIVIFPDVGLPSKPSALPCDLDTDKSSCLNSWDTGASRLIQKGNTKRKYSKLGMRDLHVISLGLRINQEFRSSVFELKGTHL